MTSTLDAVRVNSSTWAWSSCSFAIDGQATEGVVAIDWEEKLELRIVESNVQDGPPIGMSAGRYQVGAFPLRMLRDSALALKRYLQGKAAEAISTTYGQAVFVLSVQLSGLDSPDLVPSTIVFSNCRIVSEAPAHEEGTGVAVTEFRIACLAIAQDGIALWNGLGQGNDGTSLPGTDTITIGGVQAPGKWTLVRAPKVFGWDIRKGTALSGATVVPTGDDLVEAEFLVEIWTVEDYLAFQLFRTAYLKKALTSVAGVPIGLALGIDHPELKAQGCTSVVVKETNPLVNDGFGVWGASIKFLQYRKPVIAMSKPDAAIPDAAAPKPTAQTQVEIEIQKAQAALQALAP